MFNVPAVFALQGSPGEKKMAVQGHWGGDGKSFSRLAKLFLTTGRQTTRFGHIQAFCCPIIPLSDWDNKQSFLLVAFTPPTFSVSFLP